MRKLSAVVVALVAVLLPAGSAAGQESWTADEAAARLGRGVNLGNALEAPNFEGEWGMVIEDEFFSRQQMAAFLVRAFELPAGDENSFSDDGGSQFEDAIESLAAAGVTKGCNPPVNDRYCPFDAVTRGQMAAFIHRADSL